MQSLSVLRINGDPQHDEDFEAWLSSAFTIDRTLSGPPGFSGRPESLMPPALVIDKSDH